MLLSLIFTITYDLLLQSESVAKFDLYYHLVTCYCRVKVLLSLIFTITYDLLLQSESVAKFDL